MTEREFWELARRGRQWRNLPLVTCESGFCPLGAAADTAGLITSKTPPPGAAAQTLGLPYAFVRRVIGAADSRRSSNRKWLLKNLGIS